MPEEKGTGMHSHKSTREPFPHHEGKSSAPKRGESAEGESRAARPERGESTEAEARSEPQKKKEGGQPDLKSREYRDASGQIHHHTKKYQEQHKGR